MKQIDKTPEILNMLRKSAGSGVNVDQLVVFEAIAYNNRPVRKRHPLYKDSVASRGTLLLMAHALEQESLPVQIMHDGDALPVGRVFHGEVFDLGSESELRVLFFISHSEAELITKIEEGTIDQVSVSFLPEHALCSECGWDYFGPDADFSNIFEGVCANGHVIGEDGVHVNLHGLDQWFEMSLVGRGGAQNARIVTRDNSVFGSNFQRLAASGMDPNALVLTALPERTEGMDLAELVTSLTDTKVELKGANDRVAELTAQVEALTAELDEQKKLVESAGGDAQQGLNQSEAELITQQLADTTAEKDTALEALKDVTKTVLVATGDVDPALPETVAELVALITDKKQSLAAALVAGGTAKDIVEDAEKASDVVHLSGFRVARR